MDSTSAGDICLFGAGVESPEADTGDRRRPGAVSAAAGHASAALLRRVAEEVRAWFPRQVEGAELVLIDVDPRFLHALWSVPLALVQNARETLGPSGAQAPLLLRLQPVDAGEQNAERPPTPRDVVVSGLQSRTYVDIEGPARRWRATLGFKRGDGSLIALAHSQVAELPPAGPAAAAVTVGETTGGQPAAAPPAAVGTPAQAGAAGPRASANNEGVSAAAGDRWPERDAPEPGTVSQTAAAAGECPPLDHATPSPFAIEEILPLSSFVLGDQGVELEVTAELHIHGRTRPGRGLQLFGQDIRVRPDGTFALRRILPNDPSVLTALLASEASDDLEGAG